MTAATVRLLAIIQDSQEFGSDAEHMVSRVLLEIQSGDTHIGNLYVDVKQPVGSDFNTAPLEVSRVHGLKGAIDHARLSDEVEAYYRRAFGASGRAVSFGPGSRGIRMQGNIVKTHHSFQAEMPMDPSTW